MPDAPDSHGPVRPEGSAAFITPESVSKLFCSTDDRAELRRVKAERRNALRLLRSADRTAWRNIP